MEQSRKQFKIASLVVLIFTAFTLVNLIAEIFYGDLSNAALPEGAPSNALAVTQIFVLVFSFVMLLPQVYIGWKGLRVAKNPDDSKGHIIWAAILLGFAVLGLIEPVIALIQQGGTYGNISDLFGGLLDVIIFYEYIQYARAVLKGQ